MADLFDTQQPERDVYTPSRLNREARTLLETTVRGLPLKQRLAFIMRKIHDLDYDAIGRSLDCSAESARAHVFQALRKIRTNLNGHELPPAAGVEKSPFSMERPR